MCGRRYGLGLGLLLLVGAPGCADDPSSGLVPSSEPQPMLASLGAETYHRYCASCHGADARGNGPAASALKTPPADLTRIAARRGGEFPAPEIATYIDGRFALAAHGTREMPIWGEKLGESIAPGVHPDEVVRGRIATLIEYLKTIQEP